MLLRDTTCWLGHVLRILVVVVWFDGSWLEESPADTVFNFFKLTFCLMRPDTGKLSLSMYYLLIWKGGQTAILVRWSAVQRTTEILADQRTGKNSGPTPADQRQRTSANGLPKLSFRYSAVKLFKRSHLTYFLDS
jgi:hypothetical protein